MVKSPLAALDGVGVAGLEGVAGRDGVGVVKDGLVDRGFDSVVRLGFSGTGSSSQSSQRARLRDGTGAELVLPSSRYWGAMSRRKRLMTQLLVCPLW